MSRFTIAACALCALLACRDEADRTFSRAKAHYDGLVLDAQAPDAKAFDDVVAELEQVPAGSKHYPEAQGLKANIVNARARLPRAPLALAKESARFTPDVVAQLRACTRLAELAGQDGGVSPALLVALDDCRVRAEKLELAHSHGEHADDAPTTPLFPFVDPRQQPAADARRDAGAPR